MLGKINFRGASRSPLHRLRLLHFSTPKSFGAVSLQVAYNYKNVMNGKRKFFARILSRYVEVGN